MTPRRRFDAAAALHRIEELERREAELEQRLAEHAAAVSEHLRLLNDAVEALQRSAPPVPTPVLAEVEVEVDHRWDAEALRLEHQLYRRTPALLGETAIHVGNIAQNAFWNAKTLRRLGVRSLVASPDYYHYASCPEWLGLSGSGIDRTQLGSDDFPNFFRFEEAHGLRPRWFASGPLASVLTYAWLTTRQEEADLAEVAWFDLQYLRFKATAEQSTTPTAAEWSAQQLEESLQRLQVADVFVDELRGAHELRSTVRGEFPELAEVDPLNLPLSPDWLDARASPHAESGQHRSSGMSVAVGVEMPPFGRRGRPVTNDGLWRLTLGAFRYRILYAESGVHARRTGLHPFAAYEHGTIRPLPFLDDEHAARVTDAYLGADVVMVTNADYLSAEQRIPLREDRVRFVPHGFDQDACDRFLAENPQPRLPDTPTFLAPARHDWLHAPIGNDKGNNLVIEALAKLPAELDVRVLVVDYGADTDATKRLAAELGVDHRLTWLPVLTKNELWRRYLECHAVLDQFVIPAIGAIGVEALALGRRLITADNGSLETFFGAQPPLLRANSPDELAKQIQTVIADPHDDAGIGAAAAAWFREQHGEDRLVEKLGDVLDALRQAEHRSPKPRQ